MPANPQAAAGAQSIDEQKDIIAELCVGAPSDSVRNCLRKYDPTRSAWQIEKDIKKDKKEVLVDTLSYLGMPGMNQYRHDALPHELVCRVQNLLPDTCNLCKQNYCIKIEDKPILSCVKCGQGCHNSCVLQLIGKTNNDLNESNNFGEDLVNPYATLGLFYVCGGCQGETIPNKDSLKVKHGQGSRRNSLSGEHEQLTSTQQDNTSQGPAPPATQTQTEPPAILGNQSTSQVGPQARNTMNSSAQTGREERNSQNISRAAAPSVTNQTRSNDPPVCKNYRTGRCKFGVSGKKGGSCPYSHPKACIKFSTDGNRRRGGCTRGKKCKFFHLSMCHSSIEERRCTREDCKFLVYACQRHDALCC